MRSEVGNRLGLVQILRLFLQHFAVADDGVQRRAQLVAHVRQELALGPVGGFGRVLRVQQFFRGALPGGDVMEDGDAVVQHAVFVFQRRGVDAQPPAVLVTVRLREDFDVGDRLARGRPASVGTVPSDTA